MEKFNLAISTRFDNTVEVEADNIEQAIKMIIDNPAHYFSKMLNDMCDVYMEVLEADEEYINPYDFDSTNVEILYRDFEKNLHKDM